MSHSPLTFATFITTPENRPALLAAQDVAKAVGGGRPRRRSNSLFLHGPAGSGKTHLVEALIEEAVRRCPDLAVTSLAALDLGRDLRIEKTPEDDHPSGNGVSGNGASDGDEADLLVIEDIQHLPLRSAERFVQILDSLLARKRQTVVTGNVGPQQLAHRGRQFPARLTSRLAAGLVVWLPPLQPSGRLAFLEEQARRRQLRLDADVLSWLAQHLPGSARHLLGALHRVETLAMLPGQQLDQATVQALFEAEGRPATPSVEQIARSVCGYFQVEPTLLQSRKRSRGILWPRQVSMYLARKLTSLSLDQIGQYFGGRDHSTVLYACRKVEAVLTSDVTRSGAVQQLHAALA